MARSFQPRVICSTCLNRKTLCRHGSAGRPFFFGLKASTARGLPTVVTRPRSLEPFARRCAPLSGSGSPPIAIARVNSSARRSSSITDIAARSCGCLSRAPIHAGQNRHERRAGAAVSAIEFLNDRADGCEFGHIGQKSHVRKWSRLLPNNREQAHAEISFYRGSDLSVGLSPAAGSFALSADHTPKRVSSTHLKKTARALQIPIATSDFVTYLCHPTAVSCIELCRTPAR